MGVKRFDYIIDTGPEEGWMEEASHGEYVKASDYDALAAELTVTKKALLIVQQTSIEHAGKQNAALAAELALRQTAEAYAARNALRVIEVEAALRNLLDDLGEIVGQRHHRDKYRVYQISPQSVDAARNTQLFPLARAAPWPRCTSDTNNGDRCILPGGHAGAHSL